ncbi:MAG TPA: D-amino-acid transaminase [Blastocatellia bacterium]|nr:D-amino-acid transaminase [Blastocatellia bacterium]
MTEGLVWLNGEFLDFASAKVSVEDRGFQFGDGIYEVIRVYQGKPFAFEDHLQRLQRSADAIELTLPYSLDALRDVGYELIERTQLGDAELYLQVTRGVAPRAHLFPSDATPTVVMTIRRLRTIPPEVWEKGIAVITVPDERWRRSDVKSICLLPHVLAKERARRSGAYEALFVRDGCVLEGASSNLFIYDGTALITPVADQRILHGISRAHLIEVARGRGYTVVERDIRPPEVIAAQEVLLTSTTLEVAPVIAVDGTPIGSGVPGPIYRDLSQAFREMVRAHVSRATAR